MGTFFTRAGFIESFVKLENEYLNDVEFEHVGYLKTAFRKTRRRVKAQTSKFKWNIPHNMSHELAR
jgi:hypothetical protein